MKKILSLFFALLIVLSSVCCAFTSGAAFDSGTLTKELKSDIYYMENLDEGTVFFEKNSQKKTPAAAFIKTLAAVVALEKWGNLEGSVKVTKKNLSLIKYEYGVRVAGYKEGETVSKRELFDCLMIYSANDAASIIASEVSGSVGAFVKEMQALADKIGCSSTAVKNIHGFDEKGQYTTAQDVAKIIKYALNYPVFAEAFSAKTVTLKKTALNDKREFVGSNKMANATIADYYHSSVTGGKQTATDEAGECIAVVSNKDGYSYLTVVMGGRLEDIDKDTVEENTCMTDAKKMLQWVYNNIRYRVVVSPDLIVSVVDVVAGRGADKVNLVPEKEASALVPAKATPASVSYEIVENSVPEKITAPVKAGEVLGKAKFMYAGQELITVNLVAQKDIPLSFFGLIMAGVTAVITSTFFIILLFIAALVAVGYFAKLLVEYLNRNDPDFKKKMDAKLKAPFTPKKKQVKKGAAKKRPPSRTGAPSSAHRRTAPQQKRTAPRTPVKKAPPSSKPGQKRPAGATGKTVARKPGATQKKNKM